MSSVSSIAFAPRTRSPQNSANPLIAKIQRLFNRALALQNDYLRRTLAAMQEHPNAPRPHQGLDNVIPLGLDCPAERALPAQVECDQVLGVYGAEPGETMVLRGGVYRETLRPRSDGVTVRAMQGERVTISGADLIEGWKREADGTWSAPLLSKPKKVLREGQPWGEFTYDQAARRIVVKSGDPRLHLFETVVREQGIDLGGKKDVKVEGITITNMLKEAK
jgi:hypothetical protein